MKKQKGGAGLQTLLEEFRASLSLCRARAPAESQVQILSPPPMKVTTPKIVSECRLLADWSPFFVLTGPTGGAQGNEPLVLTVVRNLVTSFEDRLAAKLSLPQWAALGEGMQD